MLEGFQQVARLGPDALRNGSLATSLLMLLAGAAALGIRMRAAWKGLAPLPSLSAHRMAATLGALGGFIAYLRDRPFPEARVELILGGISAAPWAAVAILEEIRGRSRKAAPRRAGPGARE